jgi:hypothetical protein
MTIHFIYDFIGYAITKFFIFFFFWVGPAHMRFSLFFLGGSRPHALLGPVDNLKIIKIFLYFFNENLHYSIEKRL